MVSENIRDILNHVGIAYSNIIESRAVSDHGLEYQLGETRVSVEVHHSHMDTYVSNVSRAITMNVPIIIEDIIQPYVNRITFLVQKIRLVDGSLSDLLCHGHSMYDEAIVSGIRKLLDVSYHSYISFKINSLNDIYYSGYKNKAAIILGNIATIRQVDKRDDFRLSQLDDILKCLQESDVNNSNQFLIEHLIAYRNEIVQKTPYYWP